MPRQRKIYFNGNVVEIGIRLKSGLPLTAAPFVSSMIEGVLARAQDLYPIQICHYIVMSNHIHMIVVVEHIDDLAAFKQHFKTNTSKLIHAMLGTSGSIWEEGSDAPVILNVGKLIERLKYFYLNPQKAGLVDSINDYPNLSTWELVKRGGRQFVKTASLPSIGRTPRVAPGRLNKSTMPGYVKQMEDATCNWYSLTVSPRVCFEALGCSEIQTDIFLQEVVEKVEEREEELMWERRREGKKPLGRLNLIFASLHAPWTPTKRGKRMICLGSCRKQRKAFIAWHKRWSERCREIWQQWCVGNFIEFPPFVYQPRRPCIEPMGERFLE